MLKCVKSKKVKSESLSKIAYHNRNVAYDADDNIVSCLFCRIVSRQEPGTILFEDDEFIVFKTILPCAPCHLLACPKKHVRNLVELESYNRCMKHIGNRKVELDNQYQKSHTMSYEDFVSKHGMDYESLNSMNRSANEPSNELFSKYFHYSEGISILKGLKAIGIRAHSLWRAQNPEHTNVEDISFVFHVPPYNSVDHLHLHVIAGSKFSLTASLKYTPDYTFWCASYDGILDKFLRLHHTDHYERLKESQHHDHRGPYRHIDS